MRSAIYLLLLVTAPLAAQVAVMNPSVPEQAISHEQMSSILLGRSTTWSDGSPIVLVLVDDPAADRELLRFAGRPRERLVRGWKRMVFGGNGSMPLQATDPQKACEIVSRVHGAVALVAAADQDPRWRAVAVTVAPPTVAAPRESH